MITLEHLSQTIVTIETLVTNGNDFPSTHDVMGDMPNSTIWSARIITCTYLDSPSPRHPT
ncbi:hypothetical protein CpMB16_03025 [Corynebacterium pseudotuberculosis]|uniref:Uncharacterized protein n=1 Tax=Corynebacterium pseudotuberculosis 258 TaxID=1168865 RepID=A0AAX1FLA8_CORPS|nr:hypothetical protein CPCIP5297_03035 [Corynebacterium pseudotuberculosis CIP 52.97]AFB71912.1 hypothetical protein CP316_03020 [Corynebacterium pseudotuberculosis 316]APG81302.1 Hypothetical protein CPI37_0620 [Corynebacterium pseudotuberculosis]QGW56940.1 hypothetical protein CP258_03035 [Corynebacterium pseudotuberculosis 258]QGW57180.1 hypothetical protein CP31_03250 [Corynebacterium pseudotuberculosis 31]QGX02925.1 hypothetical protein CP162_07475 [Corynebacterium pseudotuberculosis Cp1